MIKNIENIKNSKIRLFPFQTQDIYFILYVDLPINYLLTLLIDKLNFKISQIEITYIYPFSSFFPFIKDQIINFEEDYFVFFLENYFHSSDYAFNFIDKLLEYLEKNNIDKKIIIHSIKTENKDILYLMNKYKSLILLVNTDIEYFFYEYFYKKTDINSIANIIYKTDNWEIITTKNENVVYDLKDYILWWYHSKYYLNFPKSLDEIINIRLKEKRKFYNDDIFYSWTNKKYIENLRNNVRQNSAMLTTGRGCLYDCSYCYRGVKYKKVRQIPLDIIKKDLDYLDSVWYTHIYLYDDCFLTTNLNRLDEILDLFKKYNFNYQIAARYEPLTPVNLDKLIEANINRIQVWLQSVSIKTNKDTWRNLDLDKFKKTIVKCKKSGINISLDLILWLPGETIWNFLKTLHFAINLKPTSIFINKLFLNPKTLLNEKRDKYGIVIEKDKWLKKDFYVSKIVSSDTFSQKDILIWEKYIISCIKKFKNINIILR